MDLPLLYANLSLPTANSAPAPTGPLIALRHGADQVVLLTWEQSGAEQLLVADLYDVAVDGVITHVDGLALGVESTNMSYSVLEDASLWVFSWAARPSLFLLLYVDADGLSASAPVPAASNGNAGWTHKPTFLHPDGTFDAIDTRIQGDNPAVMVRLAGDVSGVSQEVLGTVAQFTVGAPASPHHQSLHRFGGNVANDRAVFVFFDTWGIPSNYQLDKWSATPRLVMADGARLWGPTDDFSATGFPTVATFRSWGRGAYMATASATPSPTYLMTPDGTSVDLSGLVHVNTFPAAASQDRFLWMASFNLSPDFTSTVWTFWELAVSTGEVADQHTITLPMAEFDQVPWNPGNGAVWFPDRDHFVMFAPSGAGGLGGAVFGGCPPHPPAAAAVHGARVLVDAGVVPVAGRAAVPPSPVTTARSPCSPHAPGSSIPTAMRVRTR